MEEGHPEIPNPQINLTEVGKLGTNILGFTNFQIIVIHVNGWVNLTDFRGFTATQVTTWISKVERRTVARGGAQSGSVTVKKLLVMNYWFKNYINSGRVPMVDGFQAQALVKSIGKYQMNVQAKDIDDDAQTTKDFKYDDWIDWQKSVITYLKAAVIHGGGKRLPGSS